VIHRYFVAYRTIVGKEIARFMRIWVQTLVPPAVTMTLYFVIFGALIGSRIGEMDGYSYVQYIAPGIIMMAVITNSYSNVVSSFFSAKFQRQIEEMLIAPMPNVVIVAGYATGGLLRGLMVGVLVTVIALLFTELKINSVAVMITVVTMTALLFSLAGLVNAIFARKFDDISIVPTFVLTPLTYLGGVFYSIDLLPEFWSMVSMSNPVLYMVNAFRYGILGVSDIDLAVAFSVIGGFTVALLAFCLYLLDRGIGIKT
jgi:ABC-2 type transport system permease protein